MHVLLAAYGSRGDVQPMVALCVALRAVVDTNSAGPASPDAC
jgi:hypothetical protein